MISRAGVFALATTALALAATLGMKFDARASAPSDPAGVAKALYAAFERGDMATVNALIAPDATWTYHGPPELLPFGGTRRGRDGVADFFRKVDDTLTDARATQREFIVSGDQVAVPGTEESTVKATGVHYKVNNLHLFKVQGGKIVQFEEFIDSGAVLEAFTPAAAPRGKAVFTTCAGCHGNGAQGRAEMFAPNLTGQDPEYLKRQIANFREGRRGKVEDGHAFQMVGRAVAIPGGERGVRDVVAYIGSLSAPTRRPLPQAPVAIAAQIETCAACHGASGEGDGAMMAPALRGLSPSYIAAQLRNFRNGNRGYRQDDSVGATMAAAAKAIPDETMLAELADHYGRR